jgi:hypothetical protein
MASVMNRFGRSGPHQRGMLQMTAQMQMVGTAQTHNPRSSLVRLRQFGTRWVNRQKTDVCLFRLEGLNSFTGLASKGLPRLMTQRSSPVCWISGCVFMRDLSRRAQVR